MATPPVPREVLQQTIDMWAVCGNRRNETAHKLKITKSCLGKRLHIAKRMGMSPNATPGVEPVEAAPPAADEASESRKRVEAQGLRDKISRLEAALREADRAAISEEDIRTQILKLSAQTQEPPDWLIRVAASTGVTGVPSAIWSDWHLGEVVSRAETNGVNEFNLTIAEARIRRLVERTLDLCYRHMTNPRYPGIVINLIGDIVSGGLHPELAESDELDLFPTILWAVERITWALRQLADHFGAVFVACAPGNHGRVFDRKPRAKGYVFRNADWLIYNLLDREFRNDDRIRFSIPATGECLYSIYNHRYMAVHGDDLGVRGGDGIIGAIGPIMRGEIKMRHSSAQIDRDYQTLLMGHWHQTLWLPRAFVNNTLKGYDEYARRMLRATPTPPAQSLWFTHPKQGITARWEVRLDDSMHDQKSEWVSWAGSKSEPSLVTADEMRSALQ